MITNIKKFLCEFLLAQLFLESHGTTYYAVSHYAERVDIILQIFYNVYNKSRVGLSRESVVLNFHFAHHPKSRTACVCTFCRQLFSHFHRNIVAFLIEGF